MKKKHFKTAIASLLLSCTLLTSPLSAMAAVQMNTSTAATTAATTPKPAALYFVIQNQWPVAI